MSTEKLEQFMNKVAESEELQAKIEVVPVVCTAKPDL
jgi:hypothetical protein